MHEYLIPAIAAIVVAAIEYAAVKERKEAKKERERTLARAAIREKESLLSMQMMDATLQLSIVTANALTGGKNNGNVARAQEAAKNAMDAYTDFHDELTAHTINKI